MILKYIEVFEFHFPLIFPILRNKKGSPDLTDDPNYRM
jgi:hypothetical protein